MGDDGATFADGIVARSAVGDEPVLVTVASYDGGRALLGPCTWTPRGVARPVAGARCLVLLRGGSAVALEWWDGATEAPAGGGAAEIPPFHQNIAAAVWVIPYSTVYPPHPTFVVGGEEALPESVVFDEAAKQIVATHGGPCTGTVYLT